MSMHQEALMILYCLQELKFVAAALGAAVWIFHYGLFHSPIPDIEAIEEETSLQ